ncbi:sensor domain-containing diguanylate cyclase [Halomonas heilongjiangensis]|uniref:diguanylate cyclase n=1 Tax=Halomonas heilongjiangensis TaxID=1387883 RepID=A0A2N7TIE6_9GAMM|nr:GGDEF domain-containing protein [Halomonas heilongjiangensis]PMR67951.1 GGDEF domain-containing protein [Halomonas heilongjiangensis]PXX90511.1 GGDEF domain-containing protein [Halomonas heilongjiangensis]
MTPVETSARDAGDPHDLQALPPLPASLQARLADCHTLPSLPAAVAKVLMVARRSDASLFDYAEAIEADPALTLRLLALANSVFYARHRRAANSCREAVSRIGLDATLAAVMSFGLPPPGRTEGLDLDAIWQRAIIAALAARHLADRLCPEHAGTLFTIALLQDIGILAAEALDGDDYVALIRATASHDALCQAERERYGCDHASLGAWLAISWGVPPHLASGIAESHGELEATSPDMLCLRLSGQIADGWLTQTPGLAFGRLIRRLEARQQLSLTAFEEILDELQAQLPSMAELLEITRPPRRDSYALLAEAKRHLYMQTLALGARLDAHQVELEALRERHAELERSSRLDPLTGLANRAWLEQQLEERFHHSREHGKSLAVVFIDLDHFKRLNDRHGHQLGDRVLANFAVNLQEMVREGDLAGRYGGEEFLVILPDEREAGAEAMAMRLAERLASQPVAEVDGAPLHVSVSIGIACLGDTDFRNARELIDAADQGMYQAKRNGRGGAQRFTPRL